MQEYQRGIKNEDLLPFGSSPMDFGPTDWRYGVTEPTRDEDAGWVILLIILAIPLLCIFAFFWIKDRVSNSMAKSRHRRFCNEKVNQVSKEQVPDHIRGY